MIDIKEAVLHHYDPLRLNDVYSTTTLNLNKSMLYEYLEHHLARGLKDPSACQAQFDGISAIPDKIAAVLSGETSFLDFSVSMAEMTFEEISTVDPETSYDFIACRFSEGPHNYTAILMIAGKDGFVHGVQHDENGAVSTTITLQHALMPQPTQRIKGYAFINEDDLGIRMVDLKFKVDGETYTLFEQVILGCYPELSSRQAYKEIRQITLAVADTYSQDPVEAMARAKDYIAVNAENNDSISTRSLAEKTFPDNAQMQSSYMGEVSFRNMSETLGLERAFAMKQASTYKLTTDTDITVTIPSSIYNDPDYVNIHVEKDGTTTITLKNIGQLNSK